MMGVLAPYATPLEELEKIEYVDKIEESGPLTGHGIRIRFKVLHQDRVPICAIEKGELE
jgi:hypothetical protein